MSLTITFYTNKSDRRKVKKDLTTVKTATSCLLKDNCEITAPVITVEGSASTFASVNYMYIPAFNRYYFASVRALSNGLVEVTGKVDILSSAGANGLLTHTAIIARQQEKFNLYLNDGTFQAYANDKVVTKEFSSGFSTPSYVLVVAG